MIIIDKYRVLYLYYNELKISKITKHIYYAINSAHRVIFSAFLQKKREKLPKHDIYDDNGEEFLRKILYSHVIDLLNLAEAECSISSSQRRLI